MTNATEQRRPFRVGMITPSSNTVLEPMTYELLAGTSEVTAHFSRLRVTKITTSDEESAQFETQVMVDAARLLCDAKVDALVWNGTSGSWLGLERDHAIVSELSKETGVPATTSTIALLDSFRAYGVTRLGLVTPYTAQVNQGIIATYAKQGVEVVAENHLGITDNEAFGRVTPKIVSEQIRNVSPAAEAVAVVCTNVRGATVVPVLERELGIPVFDSVAVTLWGALRAVGSSTSFSQWGTILRDGTIRSTLRAVCDDLSTATAADRTMICLDWPEHALSLGRPAAENCRGDVASLRSASTMNEIAKSTESWLRGRRAASSEVQRNNDLIPARALMDLYTSQSQMISPIEICGLLRGWVSTESDTDRAWSTADRSALDSATLQVSSVLS